MTSDSLLARAENVFAKWIVIVAGAWLVAATVFTGYRVWLAICAVGIVEFVNKLKLSDAGDYAAGVIAVPAFIYLVRGFITQQHELQASVAALNAQEVQMKAQAQAIV